MHIQYQVYVALPKRDVENSTDPTSDNKKQRMKLKRKQPDSLPKYVPTNNKCVVKHTSEVPANTLQSPSCEDEIVIVSVTSDHIYIYIYIYIYIHTSQKTEMKY